MREVFVIIKIWICILILCNIEGQEIILFVRLLSKISQYQYILGHDSRDYLQTQGHCRVLGIVQRKKFLKIEIKIYRRGMVVSQPA